MRPLLIPLLLLASVPARAQAQSSLPSDLLADWERNQHIVLAYIEAIPDSALAFRPTPGVRTLGEQFEHILATNLEVAAIALRAQDFPPIVGDPAQCLRSKSALRGFAVATYSHMLTALREATPEALGRPVSIYGQPPQPAVRLAVLSLEHSIWTLGQVVPYLRLNGVTPPPYAMPF